MTTYRISRLAEMQGRLKRICTELDNANRRMFDIRSGEFLMGRKTSPGQRTKMTSRNPAPSH